jgi:hypothetical protein
LGKRVSRTSLKGNILKISIIILGSTVTTILAIFPEQEGKTAALIISSIVTIISSIDALFNYHSKLVAQYQFETRLSQLIRDIEFYANTREGSKDDFRVESIEKFKQKFEEYENEFFGSRIAFLSKVNGSQTKHKEH